MVSQLAPRVPGGTHLSRGIQPRLVGIVRRLGTPRLPEGDNAPDLDGVGQLDDRRHDLAAVEHEPARLVTPLRTGGPQTLKSAEEADVAVQGQIQIAASQPQQFPPGNQRRTESLRQFVRSGPQGFDRIELLGFGPRSAVGLVRLAERVGSQFAVLLAPEAGCRASWA